MSSAHKDRVELLQGTLDLIVLRALATMGPQHAYGLAARLEQVADHPLMLNQGSLYPALVRLEQQGWIKGTWQKTEIPIALNSSQRTKLVLDKYDNAYAVFPYGRIAAASKSSGYTDWTLLYDGSDLNAFGEVVIDELRVKADNVLSFMYQEKSSGTTPSALHVVDFALPA